jgi:hypothetical protein
MECTTASASTNESLYVSGFRMFALFQLTFFDHSGAVCSEETADHLGSPERLCRILCQDHDLSRSVMVCLPDRGDIPVPCNSCLADSASQETISTTHYNLSFSGRCCCGRGHCRSCSISVRLVGRLCNWRDGRYRVVLCESNGIGRTKCSQ